MLAAQAIHLGSWRKSAGVGTARATAWAARVSRARRRARVPGVRKGPGLRHLAHKLREVDATLTRGLQWPELQRKEEDDDDPRRRRSGFVEAAAAEGIRAPVQRKPTRGGLVKEMERSARPERYWWPAIARRRLTGDDGSGPNPASARAREKLGWAVAAG
jgi:hypothetical protein